MPCIAEIKYLENAYKKFKDSGLELLSVSLDKSHRYVKTFRANKYPMPWNNAYIEENKQAHMAEVFEISLPKLILINPLGKVVEIGANLIGESLEKTLIKYIDSKWK
jgi:peroxiredoxin